MHQFCYAYSIREQLSYADCVYYWHTYSDPVGVIRCYCLADNFANKKPEHFAIPFPDHEWEWNTDS